MTDARTVTTGTVGDGDDLITYDVRGDLASGRPLFMFGSPMEASYFGTLAGLSPTARSSPTTRAGPARNPTGTDEIPPGSTPRTCTG